MPPRGDDNDAAPKRIWVPPLVTTALSLAPLPFLANRYRLLPNSIAIAFVIAVVVLALLLLRTRTLHGVRVILAAAVILILAIDVTNATALIKIIFNEGTGVRGGALLLSATEAWLSNVAGFALVYWYLNEIVRGDRPPALLFPDGEEARHNIADYIFVAATIALAFGPTDTPPANSQARMAVLLEAMLAFVIVALVAARAINAVG
jgi:uncharacterized membrane protein